MVCVLVEISGDKHIRNGSKWELISIFYNENSLQRMAAKLITATKQLAVGIAHHFALLSEVLTSN